MHNYSLIGILWFAKNESICGLNVNTYKHRMACDKQITNVSCTVWVQRLSYRKDKYSKLKLLLFTQTKKAKNGQH